MILTVLAVLAAMTGVMVSGWLYQRAAQNGGWTDVFWTFGTGATCAVAALSPWADPNSAPWRRAMVAAMAAIWALRLGTYVAWRVARSREDVRYADLREEWGGRFQGRMFWLLIVQAPLTAMISLSILYAALYPDRAFRVRDGLGLAILLGAMAGETLADRQMKAFKADPANQGKVCDQGLWAWSRHPNYVFEALIWTAYPVIGLNLSDPWSLASLIAPAAMFAIVRFGTGVPPLEKAMVRSKGEAYRRYQDKVAIFLPRLGRRA